MNNTNPSSFVSRLAQSAIGLFKSGAGQTQELADKANKRMNKKRSEEDLLIACAAGDLKTVAEKLNEGVDPNAFNGPDLCHSALHYASMSGNVDVVNALIDRGAIINCDNSLDETPFQLAIKFRRTEAAKTLFHNNADIEAPNIYGECPIHTALARKENDIVDILIAEKVNLEARDRYGNTPFLIAAKTDDYKNCLKLVEQGVNVDVMNLERQSAPHLAAMFLLDKNIAVLSFAKCNFEVYDNDGVSPAHLYNLVKRKESDDIFYHKHQKSSFEINDPFHLAAQLGMTDLCLSYLQASRLPSEPNLDGKTVIEIAEKFKQKDCVTLLSTWDPESGQHAKIDGLEEPVNIKNKRPSPR